jgi:hypothetical protein
MHMLARFEQYYLNGFVTFPFFVVLFWRWDLYHRGL